MNLKETHQVDQNERDDATGEASARRLRSRVHRVAKCRQDEIDAEQDHEHLNEYDLEQYECQCEAKVEHLICVVVVGEQENVAGHVQIIDDAREYGAQHEA